VNKRPQNHFDSRVEYRHCVTPIASNNSKMKVLLFLSCLIALGFCRDICFPEEFHTHEATFVPTKEDVFITRVFFSMKYQKSRVDIDVEIIDRNDTHDRVQLIFDYPAGSWYEIIYHPDQTANCTKHVLAGKLKPMCLAKDARRRGGVVVGGVLDCDNWIETVHNHDHEKVRVDILLVKNLEIPVRAERRDVKGHSHSEWWDFEERVNGDNFHVPDVCMSSNKFELKGCPAPTTFKSVMKAVDRRAMNSPLLGGW